jgi:hypothetical protein
MSLGWQTESALLPKKAKPIEVTNDTSIFNLQNAISTLKSSKPDSNVIVEKKRDSKKVKRDKEETGRERKKEETSKKDGSKLDRIKILEQKALVYDQLCRGDIDPYKSLVAKESSVNFGKKVDRWLCVY